MKRIVLFAVLALALALALSACGKKQEAETSAVPETPATETPATDQAATPPADQTAMNEPPATPPPPATPKPRPPTPPRKSTPAVTAQANTVSVPVGTQFDVSMITPLDTRTANVGDQVEARLVAPIVQDGTTIVDEGATVRGEVTQVQRASKAKSEEDRAALAFVFTSIQTVDGEKALHATVTNSEGKIIAGGTGTRDALIIGGSTVAGAVLGKVLGKDTKGAVIGGVAGAVVGTGAVLMAKGHELEVPAGSRVQMRVDEPITVVSK